MSVMSWPAVSSMTTNCGSFSPEARATRVAAGIPIATASTARAVFVGTIHAAGRKREMAAQASIVKSDPQVPGPGFRRPAPKKVATSVAHSGAGVPFAAIWGSCAMGVQSSRSGWREFDSCSNSSEMSFTGEEMTYCPLAHLPRSIVRQCPLQKGKSRFALVTGFLQIGQRSLARLGMGKAQE